jgi:hypothetical protein
MLYLLAVRHRSNWFVSIFVLWNLLAASAGAGTIVLSAIPVGGITDPNRFICLAWGAVIGAIAFVLLLSGGSTRSGRRRSWPGAVHDNHDLHGLRPVQGHSGGLPRTTGPARRRDCGGAIRGPDDPEPRQVPNLITLTEPSRVPVGVPFSSAPRASTAAAAKRCL